MKMRWWCLIRCSLYQPTGSLHSPHQQTTSSTPPDSTSAGANKTKEQLRGYYIQMLHKVINEANVFLLMIDARRWVP